MVHVKGRDSSVGIATRYGLTVRGSNPGGGRDFPHLSRTALGPTQPPVQGVPGLSRGVKRDRGVTLTPHPLLVTMGRTACIEPQCLFKGALYLLWYMLLIVFSTVNSSH